jgi:hypothetical protein
MLNYPEDTQCIVCVPSQTVFCILEVLHVEVVNVSLNDGKLSSRNDRMFFVLEITEHKLLSYRITEIFNSSELRLV